MISVAQAKRDQLLAAGKVRGYAEAVDAIFALLDMGESIASVKAAAQAKTELLRCNHRDASEAVDQAIIDADSRAWDRKIERAKAAVAREKYNALGASITMEEIGK